MAIGDYSSNSYSNNNGGNNQNKVYDPTFYSRLKIKNDAQKLVLSVRFSGGLMTFEISQISDSFKTEPVESISISPTKAQLLSIELKKFLEYYKSGDITIGKAFGICGGMKEKVSYIGFHADNDKNILVTIGKFGNDGTIIKSATIALNKDYHYALEWTNIEKNSIEKAYDNTIEFIQIQNTVDDFAKYMNGALGYSMLDLNRYESNKNNNNFKAIFEKLGIERRSYSGGGSNDFLSNSSRVESNHTSIENIEDLLD